MKGGRDRTVRGHAFPVKGGDRCVDRADIVRNGDLIAPPEEGVSGAEATETCEEDAGEQEEPAESVKFSNIEVEGETATTEAEVEGSVLSRQTIELGPAKEEGAAGCCGKRVSPSLD